MKRVGIRDVAAAAGVSISTVSNALNRPDMVSDELVARVRKFADELGYVPLRAAQQLRQGRSGLIGMTVINIANPFFADLVAGAESAVARSGRRVLVGNTNDELVKERDHLELFESVHVDGMLISPFGGPDTWIQRLRDSKIPSVFVDAIDEAGEFSSVSFNDVAGGRLATEHLLSLGRTRLAFVGARDEVRQVRDRLRGTEAAVEEHGGATLERIWTDRVNSEVGRAFGHQIADRAPQNRPTGLVVPNDHLAIGIVSTLVTRGVRIPEDIAIVGYDDIEFAAIASVPLTSVRQPAREMGHRAAELLLARIAGETDEVENLVYEPTLSVRESTIGRAAA